MAAPALVRLRDGWLSLLGITPEGPVEHTLTNLCNQRRIGVALGAPRGRLIARMSAGLMVWTSILVVAGDLGLRAIHVLS